MPPAPSATAARSPAVSASRRPPPPSARRSPAPARKIPGRRPCLRRRSRRSPSAAETALISMQPHAAPAMNCAAISMLRLPAISAPTTATRAEQPGEPHHDQPAAPLGDDAGREHRDVESDPEHRHQPFQIGGLCEAQKERRAVDGKMQLIAQRENHHRRDESERHRAKRFCGRRLLRFDLRRLAQTAFNLRQRQCRDQQHHAGNHERQPRVLIAQGDAEIRRHRAGDAIAQHRQRRQKRKLRPCAVFAEQRQRRRAQRGGGDRPDHDQRDEDGLSSSGRFRR